MSTPIINSQMDAILSTVGNINTDLSALKTQAKNLTVKNGTYPEMAAGEIATSMGFTDKTPYLFRKTPNGVRESPTLIGGTVAWNQLADFANAGSWAKTASVSTSYSNGELTVTSNTDTASGKSCYPFSTVIPGHLYLVCGYAKSDGTAEVGIGIWAANGGDISGAVGTTWGTDTLYVLKYKMAKPTIGSVIAGVRLRNAAPSGNYGVFKDIMAFDLTLMFGSAIADYLYNLESGTAGAGIAKLKEWGFLDKPYYAYDAGSLQSVNASEHKTTAFNLFDYQTATVYFGYLTGLSWLSNNSSNTIVIPCLRNTKYYIGVKGTAPSILRVGATSAGRPSNPQGWWSIALEKAFASSSGGSTSYTTGDNARWLIVQMNYTGFDDFKANLCINIDKTTGSPKNGDYVPYEGHTYALDSSVTLRGVPKLDASNNLYYDGDTYESDGKVVRKYASVDLGSLSWDYRSDYHFFYPTNLSVKSLNLICPMYTTLTAEKTSNQMASVDNMTVTKQSGYPTALFKNTNYTTAAAFKTAMNGVYLVYELATPTEETAEGFTSPQICDPNGTEQYVDYAASQGTRDVAIPVGQNTEYMSDLKTPLEDIVGTIPTADGTYALKVTIASGVPTFSWV